MITAVTPGAPAGTVDVTVSAAAVRSATTAADRFTFKSICVVPKLTGKPINAARKTLKQAACNLGTAKGPRTGKVEHQSRKAGAALPGGTRVNVVLARPARPRRQRR